MREVDPASSETVDIQRTAKKANKNIRASVAKSVTGKKRRASKASTNEDACSSSKRKTVTENDNIRASGETHADHAATPVTETGQRRAEASNENKRSTPVTGRTATRANEKADAATTGTKPEAVKTRTRVRISGPEELAGVWQEFLAAKFTPTELEMARSALEKLPESSDEKDEITREEFDNAVNSMKKSKAPGPDGIPAEVWQNSAVAREQLFQFLQKVWNKEEVSANLSLCLFIMMFKNKDSPG